MRNLLFHCQSKSISIIILVKQSALSFVLLNELNASSVAALTKLNNDNNIIIM